MIGTDVAELDAAFEPLKADAAAQGARWTWAPLSSFWEVPIPHYGELRGFGPASTAPLSREPANWERASHYALDGDGRVVISRSYRDGQVVSFETFLRYSDGAVESVTFDHEPWSPDTPPKARAATRTILGECGRAIEHTSVNRDGERIVYVLAWSGDVLAAMTKTSSRDGQDGKSVRTYAYQYDEHGGLVAIRREDNSILYRRAPKHVKSVLDQIERELVSAIVGAIAERRPKGPVGAIGLGFASGTWLRPIVGIQSERDLAKETSDLFERWNPADMTVGLVPIELDASVDEAIAGLNRHIEDTDDEKLFRSFQRRLAKSLNARDWSAELTVAPDFAVVAVDLDDDDPMAGVRATLPKAVRKALAVRGLV
jgi:hypothetical protein